MSAPSGAGTGPADSYETQLSERTAELLPDANAAERLELLGVMDPDDMRTSLAFIVSRYPRVFDFALVRDRQLVERLEERLDEAGQDSGDQDDLEPYCARCGGKIGIFLAHGKDWHHYRGNGTAEAPNELFDAGHEPAIAWREAGER